MEMTLSNPETKTPFPIYFLIIILPFIILYWMVPFETDLTLGADYQIFSINEQMEILFSIKTGSFPLYVPGYKYGHSSSALTLSQVYHPISHIASLLPRYWTGKALEWNTSLRLLSLGLVHLALFVFLRKLRINILFAFLISFITVYNLRMLEAFRYGASFEAYTGNLLLCALISWYFICPSRWLGPLSIIGVTYLLICSGHPPMMFFGLIGAGVFTLVAPFFLATMLPDIDINFKLAFRFWLKVGLYTCLGVLLSFAYLLPFYVEFVTTNIEYAHANIQPLMGQDTFVGTLNNFFMPFISDVRSTFGGSSLLVVVLILPLLRCVRMKIPPSIWVVWGILLFILFYIQGPETPIYRLAFQYVPFVSSVGGVGRISIIVPSLMMMLLTWIINAESFTLRFKRLSVILTPYMFLGLIALILTPLYLLAVFLLKPALGHFTPHFIRNIPFSIEFVSVLSGMVSIAALILYGMYPRLARVLGVFLCLMIFLQIGTILKYGTFIEHKIDKPTFEQIKIKKKEKLDFYFHQNPGLFHAVVLNHLSRSFIEPFLGKIYTQVVSVSSQEDAYRKMESERLPQQIFIEGYEPKKPESITKMPDIVTEGTVTLVYSSFNRLQFKVNSPIPAFLGLSYPFTGHWKAWINTKPVHVYRANGVAHAIEIPEGPSLIEFRYWSDAFFWGMIISCLTVAVIGIFICFSSLKGLQRITGVFIVLIISTGGFMLWYNSLYRSDNLETEYTWTYAPPIKTPNIAYGKKTLSYYIHDSSILRFYSSRAVDGNTSPGSGFSLNSVDEALIVDLNQLHEAETIVLYGNLITQPEIYLSQDNLKWQKISFIFTKENKTDPLRITFEKPIGVRFIKVQAKDSAISIDEIEIYGPEIT